MSHALQGTPRREQSLTEQANGQRLCRSMFIGHGAGYVLIFAVAWLLLNTLRIDFLPAGRMVIWFSSARLGPEFSGLPLVSHNNLLAGNVLGNSVLLVLAGLAWCDLIVRRRHDRGQSGIEGVIWVALFVASQFAYQFQLLPTQFVDWLVFVLALGALYLFLVLVLLPGERGENAYGARPRPT